MSRLHATALFAAACAAEGIPSEYSSELTVYHLNPLSAGALPINMDTGDAEGDLNFYLGEFLLPLECANKTEGNMAGFDCSNPERVDPDLVVTKVVLEVDNRTTSYSACNLCNGTDPFGRNCDNPDPVTHKCPCTVGTYVCDCFGGWGHSSCDPSKVGAERPPSAGGHSSSCGQEGAADWQCWQKNLGRKVGGYWYSTLAEGQCNSTGAPCGWQAKSVQTVREPCLKDKLMTVVENYNQDCFTGCGPRNATSPCWIGCFMDGLLGKDARTSSRAEIGGIDKSKIIGAWEQSFMSEANGGCPTVDAPLMARSLKH